MTFSLIKNEFFLAFFSCSKNFNLSKSPSGLDGKNFVKNPAANIAGDLSVFISDLSLSLFRPFCLISNSSLFQTHKSLFDLVD